MKNLPLFYHPSTAIFVDDESYFLNQLRFVFKNEISLCKFFSNTQEAKEFIELSIGISYHHLNKSLENLYDESEHIIKFNLLDLYKTIYNKERFRQISVLVLDYQMPSVSGLEFIKQLPSNDIKKILLTGLLGNKEVVQAFNNNLIDKYLNKNDDELIKALTGYITELKKNFFIEKFNREIENNLFMDSTAKDCSIIYEKEFPQAFEQKTKELGIVEYYLLNKIGSFVMLDKNGNTFFWVTKSYDELEAMYNEVVDCTNISTEDKENLKQKTKMICLEITAEVPTRDKWNDYIYPTFLIGKDKSKPFYCSISKNLLQFDHKNIHTFSLYSST